MPDEPITTTPTESPIPPGIPPAPVAPTETPTSSPAASSTPPVVTPPESASAKAMADETPITPPAAPPPPPATESPAPPLAPLPTSGGSSGAFRSLLSKALAKIQFRKQAKLEKIMVLTRGKGQVTNDDAQKLLRVSDATASRYLSELVKNGRLRRTGVRGGAVYHFVP